MTKDDPNVGHFFFLKSLAVQSRNLRPGSTPAAAARHQLLPHLTSPRALRRPTEGWNLPRNRANGCRARAIHNRIGQTAAEGSHFSCPSGQNRPNGRRGEASHSRIGQTAAEGPHFSCPWGQNRPNGRRGEAVHSRIRQTAAEGSQIPARRPAARKMSSPRLKT